MQYQFECGQSIEYRVLRIYALWVRSTSIAKTITTLKIKLPASGETLTKTMFLTPKHKAIKILFDQKFWDFLSG